MTTTIDLEAAVAEGDIATALRLLDRIVPYWDREGATRTMVQHAADYGQSGTCLALLDRLPVERRGISLAFATTTMALMGHVDGMLALLDCRPNKEQRLDAVAGNLACLLSDHSEETIFGGGGKDDVTVEALLAYLERETISFKTVRKALIEITDNDPKVMGCFDALAMRRRHRSAGARRVGAM